MWMARTGAQWRHLPDVSKPAQTSESETGQASDVFRTVHLGLQSSYRSRTREVQRIIFELAIHQLQHAADIFVF